MAMARKLSLLFVVAVLVASICFAPVAHAVIGHTLRATKLQEKPGLSAPSFFLPLAKDTSLNVDCRLESSPVAGDVWWLKGFLVKGGQHGFVADYDMVCDGDTPAGHCDTVPHCVG